MPHHLQIFRKLDEAEPLWRRLEATGAGTAFQSYRWLAAWEAHVAPARGEQSLIVAGSTADGEPQFLLPMATQTVQSATVLGWLGQAHATYAMGLYAPGVAQTLTPDGLKAILALVRTEVIGLSAVQLRNQPAGWGGAANPFAGLEAIPSANRSHLVALTPGQPESLAGTLSKATRGKLKRSTRRLEDLPGFRFERAANNEQRLALLDIFLAQKKQQFAERGIANPFEAPGIAAFYRDLATEREGTPALLECSALHAHGEVLATATSISYDTCRHLLTLSLGDMAPEILKLSPGLTLMQLLMEQASADGMSAYDLGAGEGQHKAIWQPSPVPLVDVYMPLSIGGYAVTLAASGGALAKRFIKSNRRLWQAAQQARKLLRASGR